MVRMILELGRRCSFLPSARCNGSYKEGIHLRMAFGDKTEVNGIRIGPPLFEPEEEASVPRRLGGDGRTCFSRGFARL